MGQIHNCLIQVFADVAEHIRDEAGLNRVCLSGGVFDNVYLSNGLESRLSGVGFEVFAQNEVPAGDGGLSLRQAMIAAHQRNRRVPADVRVTRCFFRDSRHIQMTA